MPHLKNGGVIQKKEKILYQKNGANIMGKKAVLPKSPNADLKRGFTVPQVALKCVGGGNHSVCCAPQRGITRKLDQALKESLNNKAIKKESRR